MEVNSNKTFLFLLLSVYIFSILFLSLFGVTGSLHFIKVYDVSNNFIPFHTLSDYIFNFNKYNFDTWFFNTFGLIIVFIPIGFIFPFLVKQSRSYFGVVLISLLISSAFETIQSLTKYGVFDVDDILLSIVGGCLGLMFFIKKKNKGSR
ncbi:VanZ family protein [Bacillus sp. NTK074B]|uniref:VanZ family protein n=1 Tax=Bacillus sp. NTK074B TaxID=2802174 RepID=UPI001A8C2556|nr:VanZ family protein [Bacillus sp. NTK074B]